MLPQAAIGRGFPQLVIVLTCNFLEQSMRMTEMSGSAINAATTGRPTRHQRTNNFVSQKISVVTAILIAGIGNPG
jgi:hypothetical protein